MWVYRVSETYVNDSPPWDRSNVLGSRPPTFLISLSTPNAVPSPSPPVTLVNNGTIVGMAITPQEFLLRRRVSNAVLPSRVISLTRAELSLQRPINESIPHCIKRERLESWPMASEIFDGWLWEVDRVLDVCYIALLAVENWPKSTSSSTFSSPCGSEIASTQSTVLLR